MSILLLDSKLAIKAMGLNSIVYCVDAMDQIKKRKRNVASAIKKISTIKV